MSNLLNITPDYHLTRTANGVWRRYLYTSGAMYSEFTSHRSYGGWPLIHIARGRSPETGKITTARGIIAIGQKAKGVLAIGQAAAGIVAIGQAVIGVIAVGQAAAGIVAVGQVGAGILAGVGQAATGFFALGQTGIGATGYLQYRLRVSLLDTALKFFR